jgi:hypothetical protein
MSFIFSYLSWHYSKALKNIWGISLNFLWVTYRFFSMSLLFRTFFSPWRRLDDSYGKKFDAGQFFGTFVVNTLMRLVGMCVRFVMIFIGFISLVLVLIAEIAFLVVWLTLPVNIVWLIYTGIIKII